MPFRIGRTEGRRRALVLVLVAALVGLLGSTVLVSAPAHAQVGQYFQLRNDVSGKCATMFTNPVVQQECDNHDHQLWLPASQGNGYFTLHDRPSLRCLGTHAGFSHPGTSITVATCAFNAPHQQWRWLIADIEGHLVLQSRLGDVCLALSGVFSARNGWPLVINSCATTAGQFWRFA